MILCSVILRKERGETEPGWQMAKPKSETRNRKSLRLIQAMLESLLGRRGEDRRRNLRWVTLEKFSTMLCSDKVNKETESTKGNLQEPQLCHCQDQKNHNPKTEEQTPPPCLLPYKSILPYAVSECVDAWSQLKRPHLGQSNVIGQVGLMCDELLWSCQDSEWHIKIQHTTQTSVKTSVMNVCWAHQHCLCLGCSASNKQPFNCQELWWIDYYSHFLGYKTVKLKPVSSSLIRKKISFLICVKSDPKLNFNFRREEFVLRPNLSL